jgi:uncharacterized MAPEG superfamily protein
MTIPLWALLGFAVWTVVLLLSTVGVYRWSRILTGRVPIREFRADQIEGDDWYRRAMRAHANCVENLPVFGAIVLTLHASGLRDLLVDRIAIGVLIARVLQSLVHVSFVQTNVAVSLRFTFFFVQLIGYRPVGPVKRRIATPYQLARGFRMCRQRAGYRKMSATARRSHRELLYPRLRT